VVSMKTYGLSSLWMSIFICFRRARQSSIFRFRPTVSTLFLWVTS